MKHAALLRARTPGAFGWLALGLLLTVASGCRHRAESGQKSAVDAVSAVDSVSGVVAVTGTALEQQIILRNAAGVTRLRTNAADSAALSRLTSVEILARGLAIERSFRVFAFEVRRVDDEPVVDGVIRRDGESLVLDTASGRLTLVNPPASFNAMIGARVWIGGSLRTGPNSYGVIVPAK